MNKNTSICVVCLDPEQQERATRFAYDNGLTLYTEMTDQCSLLLRYRRACIELFDTGLNTGIHVDFVQGALAHRQRFGGGRGQALARAVGINKGRNPRILDVTAGLARDAWIMASLGSHVTLVERSPVLVTLLEDGIRRGLEHEHVTGILADRFQLMSGDAVDIMQQLSEKPDVIYIDPMYPERSKSAQVKKDMQILQKLLGSQQDVEQLLSAALEKANHRVVVKRPRYADIGSSIKPASCISTKTTRFDIYPVG